MGCLAPYSDLGALPVSVLSCRLRVVGGTLIGDTQPPALDACEGIDCLSTYIIDFYIEYAVFYHGLLTLCGECYGACMCLHDRVITMDSDETGHYTRVYATGCPWASAAVTYHQQVMSAPTPEAAVLPMLI
jgi:hypothetical protein